MQLNTRKVNNLIKKWVKELKRYFSKEDIQMTKKHKKMLNITHYQRDGTTMRYHFMLVRMAVIQKSINSKCWYGVKGTLLHCWWECKLVQPL